MLVVLSKITTQTLDDRVRERDNEAGEKREDIKTAVLWQTELCVLCRKFNITIVTDF